MKTWLIFQKEIHIPTQYSWKQQLHRARRGTESCQSPRADRLDRNQSQCSANPCCDLVPDATWGKHQKTAHSKYGISTWKWLFHWWWKLQICVVRNPLSHRNRRDFQIPFPLVSCNTRYSSSETYKSSNYCKFLPTYSSLLWHKKNLAEVPMEGSRHNAIFFSKNKI